MQLTHFLLVAGALAAAAHPSGHAHLHRAHTKRDGPFFVKNVHNRPIPTPTSKVKPPPAATHAPVPKPDNDDEVSDEFIPFCGGGAASKSKRVTYAQIMYKGNTGDHDGCRWNSNLMVVPNKIAHKYNYVQKYTNVASEPYQVICANKMGADGQLTGMFKVDGQKQLVFMLQPGETKTVVADQNTQGVCAFAPNEVPTTEHGQFAGVWAEFDFENTSNGGWSGADCSSLVAQAYNMDVPGCSMSEGGIDSIIRPGGIGENAYTKGMEALDGIGLNIVPGKTVIEVKVGFS
ncbi:Allergen Asp f 4 [Madurella fahalii]|uniref:Allergen Asp f 4 n=1 Tax=Madurella fahalii TaxID=1157608 RepID=A0ABQ0FYT0_9PEZI